MVINGKMVGVPMFGDCNKSEMENIVRLYEAVENLRTALEVVFDKEVAEAKIRSLGECELKVYDGEMPQYMKSHLEANGWRNSRKEEQSIAEIGTIRLLIN